MGSMRSLYGSGHKSNLATRETLSPSPASTSAFVPVHLEEAADGAVSKQHRARALELRCHPGERLQALAGLGATFSPAKVNASLPNGVKLTLECCDVRAVAAIIGALCDVQTGR
jgi:transposase